MGKGRRVETGKSREDLIHQGWPFGVSGLERRLGNGATRVIVALVAIPLLLLLLWYGGWWLSGLALLLSVASIVEMSAMLRRREVSVSLPWVIGATILLHFLIGLGLNSEMSLRLLSGLVGTTILLSIVVVMILSLRERNEMALRRLVGSSLSFLYAGLLLLSLPILYGVAPYYLERSLSFTHDGAIPSNPPDIGFWFLLLTFIAIWLTDTGAYLVGRSLGKRKLAPTISPNKSIEGAVGGLFFAVTATLLLGDLILPELDVIDLLMIGAVAGVVGQLGDLVESHLKRATGVKDSSAIIPGHGGVLDRFDSLILVAPTLLGYLVVRVAIERLFS